MSVSSYGNPIVYIDGVEITYDSINYKSDGSNKPSSVVIKSNDRYLNDMQLFGAKVTFYLNAGTIDSLPYFRGFIRDTNPSEKGISITALDALGLLSKDQAIIRAINEEYNYDGQTLVQFLLKYIKDNVNIEETLIGTNMLNEVSPVVSLSGYRTSAEAPIDTFRKNIKLNSNDIENIRAARLVMIHGKDVSHIAIKQQQSKDISGPKFSYSDGIRSVKFRERQPINIISGTLTNGRNLTYRHKGSLSTGVRVDNLKVSKPFSDPDEFKQKAFKYALDAEKRVEISIDVDKGYYLDIGNNIQLRVSDYPELDGKHVIVGKTLSCGKSGIKCTLMLNKEIPLTSEYLATNQERELNL
tara:strand:+ start:444 stop:1511 length:1068 start_codon:yes stop_codon:yes gene_type:complete